MNTQNILYLQSINDQILCLFLYHNEILDLLEQRKRFWSSISVDPRDESESQKKIKESLRAINVFGVFMVSLGITYISYCTCLSMPPIAYWLPQEYTVLETIIMISEEIWFAYSCISVFAFNTLFIGFCVNMCVQYRLISYRLENVHVVSKNNGELKREIKAIIEHHIFILK